MPHPKNRMHRIKTDSRVLCSVALWDNYNLFGIQTETDVHFIIRERNVFQKASRNSRMTDLSDTGEILKQIFRTFILFRFYNRFLTSAFLPMIIRTCRSSCTGSCRFRLSVSWSLKFLPKHENLFFFSRYFAFKNSAQIFQLLVIYGSFRQYVEFLRRYIKGNKSRIFPPAGK